MRGMRVCVCVCVCVCICVPECSGSCQSLVLFSVMVVPF